MRSWGGPPCAARVLGRTALCGPGEDCPVRSWGGLPCAVLGRTALCGPGEDWPVWSSLCLVWSAHAALPMRPSPCGPPHAVLPMRSSPWAAVHTVQQLPAGPARDNKIQIRQVSSGVSRCATRWLSHFRAAGLCMSQTRSRPVLVTVCGYRQLDHRDPVDGSHWQSWHWSRPLADPLVPAVGGSRNHGAIGIGMHGAIGIRGSSRFAETP